MCENLVLRFYVLDLVRTPRNKAILDSNPRSDYQKQLFSLVAEFQFLAMCLNNQGIATFSLVL